MVKPCPWWHCFFWKKGGKWYPPHSRTIWRRLIRCRVCGRVFRQYKRPKSPEPLKA